MKRVNVFMLFFLIASSIYLVQVSYQARRLFNELDKARAHALQLEIEQNRLQATHQAQATPARVEKTAREKLAMRTASPAVTHYVSLPSMSGVVVAQSMNPQGRQP